MLIVKTSRVSTAKNIFCLTVMLVALFGLGVIPVYEWATSAPRAGSPAAASRPATTQPSATAKS